MNFRRKNFTYGKSIFEKIWSLKLTVVVVVILVWNSINSYFWSASSTTLKLFQIYKKYPKSKSGSKMCIQMRDAPLSNIFWIEKLTPLWWDKGWKIWTPVLFKNSKTKFISPELDTFITRKKSIFRSLIVPGLFCKL